MTTSGHEFWYLTRAAGFVAYGLLFASVCLGLLMTTDLMGRRWQRNRIYDLHRFLSLLTLFVTIFHVFIVLPDAYFGFSIRQLLLPFASPYRSLFMALGDLALYLLAFVIATFYLRPLVPYRAWRVIHYATFGVFILALAHGIGGGKDSESVAAQYLYAITALAVIYLVLYRILKGSTRGIVPDGGDGRPKPLPERSLS